MNLNTISFALVGKANKQTNKRLQGKDNYKTLESELHNKLVGN